jgi:hypothetical protein
VRGLVQSTIPLGVLWRGWPLTNPQRVSALDQTLVSWSHNTGRAPNVVLDVLPHTPGGGRGDLDTKFQANFESGGTGSRFGPLHYSFGGLVVGVASTKPTEE